MGWEFERVERGGGGDSIEGKNAKIAVGCAGWRYFRPKTFFGENWKERFSSVLRAYSELFDFVEVNSTFYRLPKTKTAEKWRSEVKRSFLFSMKAPRSITHEKRFENVDEDVEAMLEVADALNTFLILFQTPKSLKFSERLLERIVNMVSTLPKKFYYGFELRGWNNEEVKKLLDRTDIVHVVDPFDREPVTGPPYYLRLHGSPPGTKMYYYKYTDEDLMWLIKKVKELDGDVYVVFNNVWMYEDALKFKRILKAVDR